MVAAAPHRWLPLLLAGALAFAGCQAMRPLGDTSAATCSPTLPLAVKANLGPPVGGILRATDELNAQPAGAMSDSASSEQANLGAPVGSILRTGHAPDAQPVGETSD